MPHPNELQIDYSESGTGPPVLFIPGSYSTSTAWRALQKNLPEGQRIVTTSLLGYGTTQETRKLSDHDMGHERALVKSISDTIGEPMHVVAHSFGATVALAAAMSGEMDILSLSLFEANPVNILRGGNQTQLYNNVRETSEAFNTACLSGDLDAPRVIIDYWAGNGAFDNLPDAAQDYCRARAKTNVLDWETCYSFAPELNEFAKLGIPTLLVRGSRANPEMVGITDTLSSSIPNNLTAVVEGASHSLIITHADECAVILLNFLKA